MGQCAALAFVILLSLTGRASGEDGDDSLMTPLRIAVAANFKPVVDELAEAYSSKRKISISSGSTGALTAQIKNGAPYDIFLAADVQRPEYLERLGLTRMRQTYAFGRLAFWHPNMRPVGTADLTELSTSIAIANPRHAPYGRAAEHLLVITGNYKSKRIKGNNVAQAFSFVQTGNVDAGLVALSQLRHKDIEKKNYWVIPADLHPPIEQQAVIMREANKIAENFLLFMGSTQARRIIQDAGYTLVNHLD